MDASSFPAIFIPLLAVAAFVSMGLFFIYIESDA